jgi:hypothetical protein
MLGRVEGVVLGLIGIALALAIPLYVEYSRRPVLRIRRAGDLNMGDASERSRITHVKVINEPLAGHRARWLLRNDANGCRVTLTFRSLSDNTEMTMAGRWSSTPQPLTPTEGGGLQFDITKLPQSERLDLSADAEGESVAVAIKHDGDHEAFGFTAQSYAPFAPDFRSPGLELPREEYEVHVEARAGEIVATATFHLENEGDHHTGLVLREQSS